MFVTIRFRMAPIGIGSMSGARPCPPTPHRATRKLHGVSSARFSLVVGALLATLALPAGGVDADASTSGGPYRNGLIAFVRCCGPAGVFVIRQDGTGQREIYRPRGDDAPLDPAWSPSGRWIAFIPGGPFGGVWSMDANGARRQRITRGKGNSLSPSWSPGGTSVVFADLGSPRSALHDLYVVRTDGSGLKRLTRASADELHPAWAPNKGEIAYQRGGAVWRMRADGAGQRLLARNARVPAWSPGGTHIAFIRGGDPWVMARDGGGAKRVAHLTAQQSAIAWSPDGRWLVTAPFDRGDLMILRSDGSEVAPLTGESGYGHSWPSWQRRPR
jgi:Tol biopolymer transport system component